MRKAVNGKSYFSSVPWVLMISYFVGLFVAGTVAASEIDRKIMLLLLMSIFMILLWVNQRANK